jgi:ketosteroid isomerase-like protein
MSHENVEIVLRSLQAFEGDEQAWLSTLDPAFEWYPIEEGHVPAHGHEGAVGIRKRWLENWKGHRIEVEGLKDGGDNVVACLHVSGRGRGSGIEVDLRLHMHWKLRKGRIVYLFEYADEDQALEAAGLLE